MKKIIYLSVLLFSTIILIQASIPYQDKTIVEGKVTDANTGEAILFGSVRFLQKGKLIGGVETDLYGKYSIELKPGVYDAEASYIGYTTQSQKRVEIKANKKNRLDFAIAVGVFIDEIVIVEDEVQAIKTDNTTSGSAVTAAAINSIPTKSINNIAASTAGVSSTDGGAISIRGSRSDAAVYYVDGVKVSGKTPQMSEEEIIAISENEEYSKFQENKPKSPFRAPLSTFAIDVDRASYSNIRRFIENGKLPPKDAVRIEEMINYFNYDYPTPTSKKRPFKVFSQLTECPWNNENKLLHIGLQGRKIETKNLPASNLVFLIDVSGSMNNHNKLPLVKESFKLLVNNLRDEDNVAIVTYAGIAGVALESTSAKDKTKIIQAIDLLGAGGSTAGAQGIKTAYDIARKHFKQDGNNRVILATDGDFNVGIRDNDELVKLIEKERNSGVFLSILGYGMGNYKDDKMQLLANKGNGNHAYIDNIEEAKKTLVEEFGGTLYTIAKDVKVQLEFNPAYVAKYRLIGYENRKMASADFRNDAKDAGELGAGHSVTVLYEITPVNDDFVAVDEGLIYQKRSVSLKDNNELGTVRLRYKAPGGHKALEFDAAVSNQTIPFDEVSDRTKHAASIAEFGMILRGSNYKMDASFSNVEATLQSIEKGKYLTEEVIDLVQKAMKLENVK